MGSCPTQLSLTISLWTHTMNRCTPGHALSAHTAVSRLMRKHGAASKLTHPPRGAWHQAMRVIFGITPGMLSFTLPVLAALCLTCGTALAQTGSLSNASASAAARVNTSLQRTFPTKAMRAQMTVLNAHEITLDGTTVRLSPGSIIRTTANALVVSGGLIGQTFVVNYTTDTMGQAHEIWILTATEAAEKRAGSDGMTPPNAVSGER